MTSPFSPETLSKRWSCSSEKIRQMCKSGKLGYFRLGKLIRIPAYEVERVECLNGDSSNTASNGASPIRFQDLADAELRLERLTGDGPKLSLVQSGGNSHTRSLKG